jgi:lipopolysaccharide biosynthesis glycosyltransferase
MSATKELSRDGVDRLMAAVSLKKTAGELLPAALELLREEGDQGYPRFIAGRACIELGRLRDAAEHLQACRRLSPRQHWAAYELARVHLLSGDTAQAVPPLADFLGVHDRPLNRVHHELCERILDREFERGQRAALAPLYRRLAGLGSRRYLTVLRAFEGLVDAADLDGAAGLLEVLGWPGDAWGHLAIARYHAARQDADQVERHALAASELLPDNPVAALAVMDHLRRANRLEGASRLLDSWRTKLPAPEVALLEVSIAARVPQLRPDVALACSSSFANRWHFIEFLYQAGDQLPDERDALYAALEARFPSDPDLLLCLANLELGRRRFEVASGFSRRGMDCAADERQREGFRFKLFETACFTGQLAEAGELLASLDQGKLDAMQRAAVARYHAELGDWAQAMAMLEGLLSLPEDLRHDHAQLLIRAARKVQGQHRLLSLLAARSAALPPTLQELAASLYQDWVVGDDIDTQAALDLAAAIRLELSPLLEFKLAMLAPGRRAALEGWLPSTTRQRRAVFFCADKAYVLPALVSLSSMLEHNHGFLDAHLYLVIDDELIPGVQPLLDALAGHYGVHIAPQPTSALVPDKSRLAAGYGLFTGGQQLAAAAYYRIYMARRLAETGDYDQLLYVDSDTVIGHGFDGILATPAEADTMLLARLEVNRPEVRQAIAQHGLPDGRYFNSGVLWFPRVSEAMIARLRQAEQAAEERGSQLLFQDQCALNIGFAGAFEPLPERFNYFAGPHDESKLADTTVSDVCMLHVLDRPKPWDSAYPRDSAIQRRWLNAAGTLTRILGTDTLSPLVELTVR